MKRLNARGGLAGRCGVGRCGIAALRVFRPTLNRELPHLHDNYRWPIASSSIMHEIPARKTPYKNLGCQSRGSIPLLLRSDYAIILEHRYALDTAMHLRAI